MKVKLDKQGRPVALIKFTRRQRASIGMLLAKMRDMNGEGALIGQVLSTGIAVKCLNANEATAIQAALGTENGYVNYPEQQL